MMRCNEPVCIWTGRSRGGRVGNERTAVAVGREMEISSRVLTQQQDFGGVGAVADRQRAAGAAGGLREAQGRAGAAGDIRKIKEIPRMEPRARAAEAHRRIQLKLAAAGEGDRTHTS